MLTFLRKLFGQNTSKDQEPLVNDKATVYRENISEENLSEDEKEAPTMKKFLIAGLGNIGPKYQNTRHNIGFKVLDYIAKEENLNWETEKLGDVTSFKFKGRTFILLKPNTYMNLSGKAVKYWMEKEKIEKENILVVTDDLNLPFGTFRIKPKGSSGGHNGLQNIQDTFSSGAFARFRFGISDEFSKGRQVDYVLGDWTAQEESVMIERIPKALEAIKSFGMAGINNTMNTFNGN